MILGNILGNSPGETCIRLLGKLFKRLITKSLVSIYQNLVVVLQKSLGAVRVEHLPQDVCE